MVCGILISNFWKFEVFVLVGTTLLLIELIGSSNNFAVNPNVKSRATKSGKPVWISCLVMMLYSFGETARLGEIELFQFHNSILSQFHSIWRTTGRFVIPAAFLVTITIVVTGVRKIGVTAVALLIFLQIFDGRASVLEIRDSWDKMNFISPLDDQRWEEALSGKERIIVIPVDNFNPLNLPISDLASRKGISTNAAYLGRFDVQVASKEIDTLQNLLRGNQNLEKFLFVAADNSGEQFILLNQLKFSRIVRLDGLLIAYQ